MGYEDAEDVTSRRLYSREQDLVHPRELLLVQGLGSLDASEEGSLGDFGYSTAGHLPTYRFSRGGSVGACLPQALAGSGSDAFVEVTAWRSRLSCFVGRVLKIRRRVEQVGVAFWLVRGGFDRAGVRVDWGKT